MDADLKKAVTTLWGGGFTCVLCREDTVITDKRRGVRPLLELLDGELDLKGFSAADKVVGKAAAFLYLLLGVSRVYAGVISQPARDVLTGNGITVSWDTLVPAIQNRDQTGFCPMETAVLGIQDPLAAKSAILQTLASLQVKNSDTTPRSSDMLRK